MKTNLDDIINRISKIRERNNYYWMEILRIAAKGSPLITKDLLKQINNNDREISKLMGKIK